MLRSARYIDAAAPKGLPRALRIGTCRERFTATQKINKQMVASAAGFTSPTAGKASPTSSTTGGTSQNTNGSGVKYGRIARWIGRSRRLRRAPRKRFLDHPSRMCDQLVYIRVV